MKKILTLVAAAVMALAANATLAVRAASPLWSQKIIQNC